MKGWPYLRLVYPRGAEDSGTTGLIRYLWLWEVCWLLRTAEALFFAARRALKVCQKSYGSFFLFRPRGGWFFSVSKYHLFFLTNFGSSFSCFGGQDWKIPFCLRLLIFGDF